MASERILHHYNREHNQCDGHLNACGHDGLGNDISCAEEEAEAYCDGTSPEQHAPHHRGHAAGLTAQESQSALIAKLVQSCEGLAVSNPLVLILRAEPIIGLPKPVKCIPGVGARFAFGHRRPLVFNNNPDIGTPIPSAGGGNAEDSTDKGHIDAKSFRCIMEMTHVRQFYVDNLLGNLDATLAVANSATGGVYPPGAIVQLIPTEAMVKRDKDFNHVTHDWEFFELDVSKDGTEIRKRGFAEVVNRFGGNCCGCPIQARPQWDLVCESDQSCAPIPLTRAISGALQRTDPRRKTKTVSPEDAQALQQLNELLKPSGS